jgi:hypothetical protein
VITAIQKEDVPRFGTLLHLLGIDLNKGGFGKEGRDQGKGRGAKEIGQEAKGKAEEADQQRPEEHLGPLASLGS